MCLDAVLDVDLGFFVQCHSAEMPVECFGSSLALKMRLKTVLSPLPVELSVSDAELLGSALAHFGAEMPCSIIEYVRYRYTFRDRYKYKHECRWLLPGT